MIRVYFLPVETIDGAEQVAGIELIYDALLEGTEEPDVKKLIQDVTPEEDVSFTGVALEARDATQEEIDLFNTQVIPYVPNPDTLRAQEILTTSPDVITMPEMWELMRIYGRHLGYRFD